MANDILLDHTYRLKGGEEEAVIKNNPFLERREPCVVFCKDGSTKMKIGDGTHRFIDLPWCGGDDEPDVICCSSVFDFPNVGQSDKIYKVYDEAKLYQWNVEKNDYEPLDNVDVEVTLEDIDCICGGDASDLLVNG